MKETSDPIFLEDIDGSNDWLLWRMEENSSDGDGDFVFNDNVDLTWSQISRAVGAHDLRYLTRASMIMKEIFRPNSFKFAKEKMQLLALLLEEMMR
ncbi:hypothetical protein V6N13_088501 [Hibiscus sabdariffa]